MSIDAPIAPEALAPAIKTLLSKAAEYGADSADAIASHGRSLTVAVRAGELEDVDNSEGKDIGLRVMVGQRQACVSSSDFSSASLDALAERAVAMARLAPEDPYCGLAEEKLLQKDTLDLALFDPETLLPEQLKARALEVEKAALSVSGVTQAEGASAGWSTSGVYFMTSAGFASGWRTSRHDMGVMALAVKDDDMERDADFDGARWLGDLKSCEMIGRSAGERAVARLGASQLASGQMPVMYDRRLAGGLVGAFLGAINGAAIARGISFLKDSMGEPVFGSHINIIDDPMMPRGHGSRPWDGEGVRPERRALVSGGNLTSWLLNTAAARQLGLTTTGHANRSIGSAPSIASSNCYMEAGPKTPQALMADMGHGLLVTDMFGPSLNQNTGDYSVGVAGFKIENGERTTPVSEITVAGNLKDIFKSMTPANDLEFDGPTAAPSLLIESMAVAGS